jgi:hypothetical protein
MSEEDIKSRIISFRVSDHDYEAVEQASRKQGFASVSLFARSATLAGVTSEVVQSPLDVEINRLWRRIEVLTTTLEQIAAHPNIALEPS